VMFAWIRRLVRQLGMRRLFFDLWYLQRPPWDTGISPPELLAFLEEHPPGRALDLGCGTGTNVITMAQRGWDVVGVDFARRAIRKAERKAREAGVSACFRVADVSQPLPVTGPFDLILDMGCYHSLPPEARRGYQENVRRLLAPGGTYMLYAFLANGSGPGPSGIREEELADFAPLELVRRQYGTERGLRPSAWFVLRKPAVQEAP